MKVFLLFFSIIIVNLSLKASVFCDRSNPADSTDNYINGWLYHSVSAHQGHPFFSGKNWEYGEIDSETGVYKNILINYDIYQDVLLTSVFRNGENHPLILNPELVNGFTFSGYRFINLNRYLHRCEPTFNGYHQILYEGNIVLVYKWKKNIIDENVINASSFSGSKEVFMIYRGNLFSIKRNSSIYRIFPENKHEIKKFIRKNNIYLNQENENELIGLTEFCDKLTSN